MANNLVESLAQLRTNDPKRANWVQDCNQVGTNTFGFWKPKLVKEIIAGTKLRYDFKSAYSTNPTITPVLSRAKVQVVAIWIPISLYVPALRDGAQVKAGRTDFAFPTVNFNYHQVLNDYDTYAESYVATRDYGNYLPYIPSNSIFTDLEMWAPYFQPIGFVSRNPATPTPPAKNAIPLLGYYDFFRNNVMNSQVSTAPFRLKGYSRRLVSYPNGRTEWQSQAPVDRYLTRDDFDNFFSRVRVQGSSYPMASTGYDITSIFEHYLGIDFLFPRKTGSYVPDEDGNGGTYVAFNDDHYGEVRSTYMGDYFTSFLSNENVEYESSTARVTADDGGVITMEQIYSAERIQRYIRRTVFKNSDYSEFIDSQYGIRPPTNLTSPLFLGAVSTWLSFNDVVSTSQSGIDDELESNESLGSRASLGFGRMVTGKLRGNGDRPFVEFTAKEPGYFMVLEHIVPEIGSFTHYQPMYDKHSLESLFYPDFDKDGYQDKQLRHIKEQHELDLNQLPGGISFDNYNIAYAQEPAWWEYMITFNRISDQMVDPGVYRNWVFSRDVNVATNMIGGSSDFIHGVRLDVGATLQSVTDVYVDPEAHQHVFANINGLDNIQTFYRHELKLYQPISHRFLSF